MCLCVCVILHAIDVLRYLRKGVLWQKPYIFAFLIRNTARAFCILWCTIYDICRTITLPEFDETLMDQNGHKIAS